AFWQRRQIRAEIGFLFLHSMNFPRRKRCLHCAVTQREHRALHANDQPPRGNWSTIFTTAARIFSAFDSGPPTTAFPTPRKTSFFVCASTKSRINVPSP